MVAIELDSEDTVTLTQRAIQNIEAIHSKSTITSYISFLLTKLTAHVYDFSSNCFDAASGPTMHTV